MLQDVALLPSPDSAQSLAEGPLQDAMIETKGSIEPFVREGLTENLVRCTAVSVDKRVLTLRSMMNCGVSHSHTHVEPAGANTIQHPVLTLPAFQWVLASGVSCAPLRTK